MDIVLHTMLRYLGRSNFAAPYLVGDERRYEKDDIFFWRIGYRWLAGHTYAHEGAGLGLALVKSLMELPSGGKKGI